MLAVQRALVVVVVCLLYMMPIASAEVKNIEEHDGIMYFCGDPNYPLWSMGNKVAAVADLSSAYIADENEKWRLIGFLSFPLVLDKNNLNVAVALEEEVRECWFWQKIKTGDIFFYRDGRAGSKVEGVAFERELSVYQMLLEAAEFHAAGLNG